MSDGNHGTLGPEMSSGSDGPAIGPEDTQGLLHSPVAPDDWHARFFSWLADYEPTRTLSNDSMSSLTPSPRRGPATAHGGHVDTLAVYHAYRQSRVDVSDMFANDI